MVLSEPFKECMTIQSKRLCRINDFLRITCEIMSLKRNYKPNNKGGLFEHQDIPAVKSFYFRFIPVLDQVCC